MDTGSGQCCKVRNEGDLLMALLFIDGFDHYVTREDMNDAGWNQHYINCQLDTGGRNGGKCLRINDDNSYMYLTIGTVITSATIIIGFAFKCNNYAATSGDMLRIYGYSGLLAQVDHTSGGAVYLRVGSTIKDTSTETMTNGQWYYVELKMYRHATLGTMSVHVDGAEWCSFSGDTEAYNSYYNRFMFVGYDGDSFYDDMYIADDTGSGVTDFLGDVVVEAIYPSADSGTPDWTKSAGSTNYENVDDPLLDTNYVSSSTVTDEDLYDFDNLSATADTVFGVQISARVSKDNTGERQIALRTKSGTDEQTGADKYFGVQKQFRQTVFETTDNGTTPWTKALVDGAQFGIKLAG